MKKIDRTTLDRGEIALIALLSVIFIVFFVILVFSLFPKTPLLIQNRTLKKALSFQLKDKEDKGLGGAYKPDTVYTPVSYFNYPIQTGESIHSIARKFGMDEVTLVNINNIQYASVVRAGRKLKIPNQDGIVIKIKNEKELIAAAKKYNFEKEELGRINALPDQPVTEEKPIFIPGVKFDSLTRSLMLGEYFRRPAYGRFTSMYGYRKDPWTGTRNFHQGVDIANRSGGNIYSAAPGTVIYTGWSWIYGNMIRIKHTGGYVTLYGHLDRITVKRGSWVNSGTVIGKMGSTGRSTGTHLHYEVRQWGRTINPMKVTIF